MNKPGLTSKVLLIIEDKLVQLVEKNEVLMIRGGNTHLPDQLMEVNG